MDLVKRLFFVMFIVSPSFASAETFYEVSAGAGKYALDIFRKRGQDFEDNSAAASFSFGAYRLSDHKSAWGAVIEYSIPISRDDVHPGDGTLLGFRPINYLRYIGSATTVELYAGVSQYEWRKTANGYYLGTNVRYNFYKKKFGIGIDAKYYQDLAFDSPEGDDIVDGFNTSLKLFYRFQ